MIVCIIWDISTILNADAFVCAITSPSFNTIGVSCELLGNLVRVTVILNCTSCIGSDESYTILGDSPVVIPNLPAGNYSVDVIAVDISNVIIRTMKVIIMSDNVTTDTPPTHWPKTNIQATDGPITNQTATDTVTPTTESTA